MKVFNNRANFAQKIKETKQSGFTLVELMVVVAIIGILSAVAVPNFKKYQAKAKTTEAKLALSAIYGSEQALMTDYDAYATCLTEGGYEPTGKTYYATGFNAGVKPTTGSLPSTCTTAAAQRQWAATKGVAGKTPLTTVSGSALADTTFTAVAKGYVTNATADKWTIDQGKILSHIVVGY